MDVVDPRDLFRRLSRRDVEIDDDRLLTARLDGAIARYADFRGADLRGASFSGADLTYANLIDAVLRDTTFHGAELSGARLPPHFTEGLAAAG